jgi:hypothetical protein
MFFLVQDVLVYLIQLAVRIGKCAISFLPGESALYKSALIDEVGCIILYIPHQVGDADAGFNTEEQMDVVCDTIDNDGFLIFALDDTCHIFEHIVSPGS